jgi:hypothetical protein
MAVNPAGGSGFDEGRDSWTTPRWLTELIGPVDLDPCGNPRSTVQTPTSLCLENGDDGLCDEVMYAPGSHYRGATGMVHVAGEDDRVFINCPYARGQVLRWVEHWRNTRFIFLLRFDPSTKWFGELFPHSTHIWWPDRRINFEPPPGVKSSSNPFPHALYMRDPSAALQMRLGEAGFLVNVR